MQHGNVYFMLLVENRIVKILYKSIQIYSFYFSANFSFYQVLLWVRGVSLGVCVWFLVGCGKNC